MQGLNQWVAMIDHKQAEVGQLGHSHHFGTHDPGREEADQVDQSIGSGNDVKHSL